MLGSMAITQATAVAVAVTCTAIGLAGPAWADERLQDQPVNPASRFLAAPGQVDGRVAVPKDRLQRVPVLGLDAEAATPGPARLDPAVPADSIPWIALDRPELVLHAGI